MKHSHPAARPAFGKTDRFRNEPHFPANSPELDMCFIVEHLFDMRHKMGALSGSDYSIPD
jgi:hypothetical protein